MTHASLFSGIGGFDLAAEWAGWANVFNCEIDPFCRRVLAYHFPNAIQYEDIKTTDFRPLRGCVDVLTGGFPCQPFSLAGKRKGTDDNRYLWPEMLRAIRELAPRWVVGENVFGIVNWSDGLVFEQVCADLENEGYEVQPYLIPACAVDAPHRRDRVWFVAHRRDDTDTLGHVRRARRPNSDGQAEDPTVGCDVQLKPKRPRKVGVVADTDLFGNSTPCTRGGADQEGAHNSPREGEGRSRTEWADGLSDVQRSNPNGGHTGVEILQREGQIGVCEDGVASDAQSTGRASRTTRQREIESRGGDSGAIRRRFFDGFPTQSPVCGRDDGLSARLDGITFPCWRRNSIKAYGNAVVPQVVLRIFETINEYENN